MGWRDARAPWMLWECHNNVESYWRESFREGLRLIWAAWATLAGLRAYLRTDAAAPLRELAAEERLAQAAEAAEAAEAAQADAAEFRAWWFRWQ